MKEPIKVQEVETDEYIQPYDVPPMFATYESISKGAPGKKAK